MIILLLTPLMGIGGEELSTLTLSRELVRRGHKVFVMGTKTALCNEFMNAGVIFEPSPYKRSLSGIAGMSRRIQGLLEREYIDIIHSQSALPTVSAFLASRKRPQRRPRLVFHNRGIHWFTYPIIGTAFNHMTDLVIANSNYEKEKLLRHGLRKNHCIRVYNSVNISFPEQIEREGHAIDGLGLNDDDIVIGTVGRLVKEKAIDVLLKAFSLLLKEFPKAKLLIVGAGQLEGSLRKEAEALGISGKTIFTGARRDLEKIYPLFDVFVLSSVFETFGNVALEANAFGKPVVATRVGGLPEAVLDGETGILVPPKNPLKLAETILYLLRNPEIARRMGQAGSERVKRFFMPKRVAEEMEVIYESLLSRR